MGGYAPRGGLADRWGKAFGTSFGRSSLPPLHGDAFQLLRWPICGSLMHGRIDGTERLNVELPSKGARVDNMEVQRLHRCLLSEAADERQFVRGLVLRVPRQTDAHQGGEQLLGEQLEDEQMRLRLPTAGQLVVNECALAVLALRVTASKVGPASAVNRALVQLALPRTGAEAFAPLDDPRRARACARTCGSTGGPTFWCACAPRARCSASCPSTCSSLCSRTLSARATRPLRTHSAEVFRRTQRPRSPCRQSP